MANTVSTLSYANTFGDWVVTTNALVRENNDFAANNYIKPTGTLYLNDPTLGLQSGNTIVAGELQVQGVGSSAYIQNNLRVDTQVYFTNTTIGLTNSGQANIGGLLLALGSGTGLIVTNTANVGGQLNAVGATRLGNTLTVAGQTQINNGLNVTGNTHVSNTVYVDGTTTISNNLFVSANTNVSGYVNAYYDVKADGGVFTNNVHANTMDVTHAATMDILQVNTSSSVAGTSYTDKLQSNTSINTRNISVTTNTYTGNILANTAATAPLFYVNDSVYINSSDAHLANVIAGSLQVNGNFVLNGQTVYSSNNFTLAQGISSNQNGYVNIYRPTGTSNATIRWNEVTKYWDILDVNAGGTYSQVLTANMISDSVVSTSSSTLASSKAANTLGVAIVTANTALKSYTDNTITTANTSMKSYVDTANTSMKSYVDTANTSLKSYVDSANTSMKSYVDTANTSMKSYTDNTIATANTSMKSYVDTRTTSNIAEGSNQYFTTARARASVSATGSLSYNSTTGVISFTQGNTDTVSEGSTNQYFTTARARATISASGSLAYNSTTGVVSYSTPNTDGVGEGSTNLYYTTTRARAAISASGSLSYNSTTGVVSYSTPNTDGIGEGSTNKYYTDARARASVSAAGSLAYNSSTGVFSFTTPVINYDNTSNSTYKVIWGSGATGFYTAPGIYVNPYYNNFYANGDITAFASSDKKFKENVRDIPNAMEIVNAIGGKFFDWTDEYLNERGGADDYHHRKEDLGVIAQDVQAVLPVAVRTREDGTLAVNYEKMVALAFQAIKELKAEVEELKKQLP